MTVDLSRLSDGERVACVSAIVFFILMFFHWFEFEAVFDESRGGPLPFLEPFAPERSTWEALGYVPFVFVVAISVTLTVGALRLTPGAELPVQANAAVALCGIVSVLLILFRIVDPPTLAGTDTYVFEGVAQISVFLALVAALGIAAGGLSALRREALLRRDRLRR
jgi:hypothetical protein